MERDGEMVVVVDKDGGPRPIPATVVAGGSPNNPGLATWGTVVLGRTNRGGWGVATFFFRGLTFVNGQGTGFTLQANGGVASRARQCFKRHTREGHRPVSDNQPTSRVLFAATGSASSSGENAGPDGTGNVDTNYNGGVDGGASRPTRRRHARLGR